MARSPSQATAAVRNWLPSLMRAPDDQASAQRLSVLIGIVFLGFVTIIALNPMFSVLLDESGRKLANERARLFVGEELMRGIKDIEIETFRLATSMGLPAQDRIAARLAQRIDKLERDLLVLRDGGAVRQSLPANVEGADDIVREAVYRPDAGRSHVVEVIELSPQIDQIGERMIELRRRIRLRDELRDQSDRDAFVAAEKAVKSYLKELPTFFFLLHETASRHFVETGSRVQQLEGELAARRQRFEAAETALMSLVIALVMMVGIKFVRQINRSSAGLRAAHDAMRAAKEEAESASRAKSDFVSRMSHELRTPLNAILGFAQLLKNEQMAAPHRVYLEEIDKAGVHLLSLINQVLDLAKVEAGRLELDAVAFDPVRLLDEVTAVVAQRAYEKGLKVRACISPRLPARVTGDATRLRQVLINLLGNAVKFTDSGEIGLSAQPVEGTDRILFRVWDTGPGIDQSVLPRLFHAFVQADTSTMRRFGGSGLGLMICRELVLAMGGTIEVDTQLGQGSCFWFALPLAADPHCVARPLPLADAECLVACADRDLAEALRLQIEALGGRTTIATTAAGATAEARRAAGALRLVAADIACRAVLELPELRSAPMRLLVAGTAATPGAVMPAATAILHLPVTYSQLAAALAAPAGQDAGCAAVPAPSDPVWEALAAGARILLVEDNPVNRLVAGAMLEKLGLGHDWAGDGSEALARLEQGRFDLVLMDMEMPVMDGIDATLELRRREAAAGRARLPVIAMTANALAQDRQRCLDAGMDDHLGKPVRIDDLGAMLKRWLSRPRQPAPGDGAAATATSEEKVAVFC